MSFVLWSALDMYSYDRTAAGDDTKAAIAWLYKKRKAVITKAFKAMGVEFDKLQKEALEKFPELDLAEVHKQLQLKEQQFKDNLAR